MMIKSYDAPETLRIRRLFSFHYFQFASGYVFRGERHPFWEMVYVDSGEADIGAGKSVSRVAKGEIIFHKPNEFHSIWASYADAPNMLVMSFACSSPAMRAFRGLKCALDAYQRALLKRLMDEAQALFGQVLDLNPVLTPLPDAPPGAPQMLCLHLEELLISILRSHASTGSAPPRPQHESAEVIERVAAIMRGRPDGSLSFADICRASGIGETSLKRAFREHGGSSVMEYYRRLRLEEARRLLRAGQNASQTAETLGYSSVHAFSRQFKSVLGMTPTQYIKSIRM